MKTLRPGENLLIYRPGSVQAALLYLFCLQLHYTTKREHSALGMSPEAWRAAQTILNICKNGGDVVLVRPSAMEGTPHNQFNFGQGTSPGRQQMPGGGSFPGGGQFPGGGGRP